MFGAPGCSCPPKALIGNCGRGAMVRDRFTRSRCAPVEHGACIRVRTLERRSMIESRSEWLPTVFISGGSWVCSHLHLTHGGVSACGVNNFQAMFNNGDRCGYVLKPTSRLANRPFIPAQQRDKYSHYHWTINLQVSRRRTRPTSPTRTRLATPSTLLGCYSPQHPWFG